MESIVQYLSELRVSLDWPYLLKAGGVLLLGCLLVSLIGRFLFGKKSGLTSAVSAAFGIVFIYAITLVLQSYGVRFQQWIAPLPFVTMQDGALVLFNFFAADYKVICNELVSMIILAFLINLIDSWLSKSKNFFLWLLMRVVTVALAYGAHLLLSWLFTTYMPDGFLTYAPVILLGILLLMILTGALKLLVGAAMATVNPVIAALYTFFFANLIGKQVSKAVVTTGLLAGLVMLLRYLGVTALYIASAALAAYIPFVIILILLWYLVNRLL